MQQEALIKSKEFNRSEKYPGQEEIDFYKQKNRELEERVNNHIAVNKNLKERIDQFVESNGRPDEAEKLNARIF